MRRGRFSPGSQPSKRTSCAVLALVLTVCWLVPAGGVTFVLAGAAAVGLSKLPYRLRVLVLAASICIVSVSVFRAVNRP